MFPAFMFAWFFETFFKFQTFKQTIVLNFLFENPHSFFEIVIDHFDFDFFQMYRPFLHIVHAQVEALHRWLFEIFNNVERDNYMKS